MMAQIDAAASLFTEARHVILLAVLAVSLADGVRRAVEVDARRRDPDTPRNILFRLAFCVTGKFPVVDL